MLEIYTDGACSGNPGKGGYGIILKYGNTTKELSCGYIRTTNNRMELLAVIKALEALTISCNGNIYSDSQYVCNAIKKGWLKSWKIKGWKNSQRQPVKNRDLWERLDILLSKHNMTFNWIKGHNDHPENERCDELARMAISSDKLKEDTNYKV